MTHLVTKILEHILFFVSIAWVMHIIRDSKIFGGFRTWLSSNSRNRDKKGPLKTWGDYVIGCTTCLPVYLFIVFYPPFFLFREQGVAVALFVSSMVGARNVFEKWYLRNGY